MTISLLYRKIGTDSPISLSRTLFLLLSAMAVAAVTYFTILQIPPDSINSGMRFLGWSLLTEEFILFLMAIAAFVSKGLAIKVVPIVAVLCMTVPPFLCLVAFFALLQFYLLLQLVGTLFLCVFCLLQWYLLLRATDQRPDA